jgi:hypothetical protein
MDMTCVFCEYGALAGANMPLATPLFPISFGAGATNMRSMFSGFGADSYASSINIGPFSNNFGRNATDMQEMFSSVGKNAHANSITIAPFPVNFGSKVETVEGMFAAFGDSTYVENIVIPTLPSGFASLATIFDEMFYEFAAASPLGLHADIIWELTELADPALITKSNMFKDANFNNQHLLIPGGKTDEYALLTADTGSVNLVGYFG